MHKKLYFDELERAMAKINFLCKHFGTFYPRFMTNILRFLQTTRDLSEDMWSNEFSFCYPKRIKYCYSHHDFNGTVVNLLYEKPTKSENHNIMDWTNW